MVCGLSFLAEFRQALQVVNHDFLQPSRVMHTVLSGPRCMTVALSSGSKCSNTLVCFEVSYDILYRLTLPNNEWRFGLQSAFPVSILASNKMGNAIFITESLKKK